MRSTDEVRYHSADSSDRTGSRGGARRPRCALPGRQRDPDHDRPSHGFAPPAGTLTLATTSEQGTVTWSESDEVTQAFTGGQFCAITDTPGSDELLRLSGTLGTGTTARDGIAGFRGGEVGVFEFDNASQCFRVDAGSFTATETLVLALGGDLRDTFGQLLATSATFGLTKQRRGPRGHLERSPGRYAGRHRDVDEPAAGQQDRCGDHPDHPHERVRRGAPDCHQGELRAPDRRLQPGLAG